MSEYALRLTNGTDTAPRMRRADALPLHHDGPQGTRGGLRPDGGGVVTVVSGGMQVQVQPLTCWVEGGASAVQGGYPYVLDATTTLAIADGDASLERTDTVAVVVYDDAFDSSGATSASVQVVQGTPGDGAPALPTNAVALYDVIVPAGASAGTGGLSAGNLGPDRRAWTVAAGGVLPVSGAAERDALGALEGQAVYREDTGKLQVYAQGTWRTMVDEASLPVVQGGEEVVDVPSGTNPQVGSLRVDFSPPFTTPPHFAVNTRGSNPHRTAVGYDQLDETGVTIYVSRVEGSFSSVGVAWHAYP